MRAYDAAIESHEPCPAGRRANALPTQALRITGIPQAVTSCDMKQRHAHIDDRRCQTTAQNSPASTACRSAWPGSCCLHVLFDVARVNGPSCRTVAMDIQQVARIHRVHPGTQPSPSRPAHLAQRAKRLVQRRQDEPSHSRRRNGHRDGLTRSGPGAACDRTCVRQYARRSTSAIVISQDIGDSSASGLR